jgi:Domain of unknown function (DUF4258)
MRRIPFLILIFTLFINCHARLPEPEKNGPSTGVSSHEPFDPRGQLVFTKHARCRMDCRHITEKEIHEILNNGTINYGKSEPDGKPDSKWAVEGFTDERQHLRIVVAPEGEKLIVITCIELGVEWSCDCH